MQTKQIMEEFRRAARALELAAARLEEEESLLNMENAYMVAFEDGHTLIDISQSIGRKARELRPARQQPSEFALMQP